MNPQTLTVESPAPRAAVALRKAWPWRPLLAGTLLALFLAANLVTSTRSPAVWQDEVMFADPAINLLQGEGFTTSAWFQPSGTYFAGNSPLYSACLIPWMAVLGINATAVRSFDYVVMVIVCALIWHLIHRQRVVRSAAWQAVAILAMICGCGMTFACRAARYDCLGMLLVTGVLYAGAIEKLRWRRLALFALCAACPWTGLQLIPYLGLVALVWLYCRPRQAWTDMIVGGAGFAAGGLSLYGFFAWHGVWPLFVATVGALARGSRPIPARFGDALSSLIVDPSQVCILGAVAVLYLWQTARGHIAGRVWLATGLLLGTLIPTALAFTGKYPIYYSWMAFVPTLVCLVAWCERTEQRGGKVFAAGAITLACLVGLPARTMITLGEWQLRDPAPVEALVRRQLHSGDIAYSDFSAYYDVKNVTPRAYVWTYLPHMSDKEAAAVTAIVTNPDKMGALTEYFGTDWTCIDHYDAISPGQSSFAKRFGIGSHPHKLAVFRRTPHAAAGAPALHPE